MWKVVSCLVIVIVVLVQVQSQSQIQSQRKNDPESIFGVSPKPVEKVQVHKPILILDTLFLSSSEVKLFSGHALNFLRTVCPRVNSTRIHEIQKMISTRTTASIHQASDKKTAFNDLLKSLRSCTSKSASSHQPRHPQLLLLERYWKTFVDGMHLTFDYLGLSNFIVPLENCLYGGMDSIQNIFSVEGIKNRLNLMVKTQVLNSKTKKVHMKMISKKGWKSYKSQTTTTSKYYTESHISKAEEKKPAEGLMKYQIFVDELFRLYSETCRPVLKLNIFFKAAGQDLISYMIHDKQFMEQSANYYLDLDFLESIRGCNQNQSRSFFSGFF